MPNQVFPEETAQALEGIADTLEALHPGVTEVLGQITVNGASIESLDWTGRLSDAAERVFTVLEGIFGEITETPTRIKEDNTPAPLSQAAALLLEHALKHPGSRAEEILESHTVLSGLSAKDLSDVRGQLKEGLKSYGIETDWDTTGRARGTRYTLRFVSGQAVLDSLLLGEVTQDVNSTEEHAAEVHESGEQLDPQAESSQLLEELEVPQEALETDSDGNQYVVSPEALEDYISTHKRFQIKTMLQTLLGTSFIPPENFRAVMDQLSALSRIGDISYEGDNVYISRVPQRINSLPAQEAQGVHPVQIDLADFIRHRRRFTMGGAIAALYGEGVKLSPPEMQVLRSRFWDLVDAGTLVSQDHGYYISNAFEEDSTPRNSEPHQEDVRPVVDGSLTELLEVVRASSGKRIPGMKPKNRGRW